MRNGSDEVGKVRALLVVVLVVLAAVGAGAYYFTLSDQGGSTAEGPDIVQSASPSPSALASYGWGEVLLEVERQPEGVNVYFVNEGRVGFADLVLRCVERYRKDFDSVACYGFPSAEAFQTAEVDPESGGMKKKCWQAYYSVSGQGKDEKTSAGAIDNGQASDLDCPIT